ncbi:hypothetical protein QYE76_062902 [Lolium multiflorum]|uniref:Uncharacterized protein n=1 Tax=Lolium multiflorum TaxID=4521 RepID=A0AAD8S3Z5_LOLMU|nr:hypothetical protein QYE76_062902 [Lolium multiflorum]
MAAADLGAAEWERSKITNQDLNLLKKLGISKKPKAVCLVKKATQPLQWGIGDDEEEVPIADVAERKKLAEVNERANTLAQKLEQSEEARKKAESNAVEARREADKAKADAAGVEDLRKRLHDAETSLSDHIAAQIAREEAITKHKTSQEFELEDPDNDPLLDAILFLEFHGTEAREGIDEAKAGLSRLFPYFFPKKEEEPATFLALAKCFNPPEDLGLKMRHENMKVAIESNIALVADSQRDYCSESGQHEADRANKMAIIDQGGKAEYEENLAYLGIKPSSTPAHQGRRSSLMLFCFVLVYLLLFGIAAIVLLAIIREKIALQQAQAAIAEKDSAVAAAASRENSMLQLLIDASLDMADCFGSVDKRRFCVAVFGVVRILHNTLGSSSAKYASFPMVPARFLDTIAYDAICLLDLTVVSDSGIWLVKPARPTALAAVTRPTRTWAGFRTSRLRRRPVLGRPLRAGQWSTGCSASIALPGVSTLAPEAGKVLRFRRT